MLSLHQLKADDPDQAKTALSDLLSFKRTLNDINYSSNTFIKFNILMKPILEWIELSRGIIKGYYKSLDNPPSFNSLGLLEP